MEKKHKILHIITTLELGGAQKNAAHIITYLPDERFDKYFVSGSQGILQEQIQLQRQIKAVFLPFLKRVIFPADDLKSVFWLCRYMRKEGISIVHTHSSKAGIIGRWAAHLAKVPVIIHTIHGWSFNDCQNIFIRNLYVLLERAAARITTRLIAVSQNDIEKGIKHKIASRSKYRLIRYGISLEDIEKDGKNSHKKEALGITGRKCVGMIACLKPQKNIFDFVRAAKIIIRKEPDVTFVIIGDGVLRAKLEKMLAAEKLADNFILLGWRKDVYRIIPCFDVVALTSLWEGLPISLLEAMACAKPVVAYDTDGIKEIIKDNENGYLIKQGDYKGLAEKIFLLLKDEALAKRMCQRAKQILADSAFFCARMMKEMEQLYINLAQE
ncbi:MAG: glycosyltransferase family 4 protein [Candidatus Omnitrophica bacterium]|nr:glycosyltransferase family 4 protein [Candidatus Omnitrophota bacterium]